METQVTGIESGPIHDLAVALATAFQEGYDSVERPPVERVPSSRKDERYSFLDHPVVNLHYSNRYTVPGNADLAKAVEEARKWGKETANLEWRVISGLGEKKGWKPFLQVRWPPPATFVVLDEGVCVYIDARMAADWFPESAAACQIQPETESSKSAKCYPWIANIKGLGEWLER